MIYKHHLFICNHERTNADNKSCGDAAGLALVAEFKRLIKVANLPIPIRAQKAGCFNLCNHGSMVAVYPEGVFYKNITLADVSTIVTEHLINGNIVEALRYYTLQPNV